MRRPVSLALAALFVVLAIIASLSYLSPGARPAARVAPAGSGDSIAQLDSAAEAEPRIADTMCIASRIGLPCDPR